MKNFKYIVDEGKYVFEMDGLDRVSKAVIEDVDFYTRARNEVYQQVDMQTKIIAQVRG